MPVYDETQQNPYRWPLFAIAILLAGLFLIYTYTNHQFHFLWEDLWLLAMMVMGQLVFLTFLGVVLSRRLDVRIDEAGVHFRAPLACFRWQSIPWSQIERIYIREYALLGEYPRGFLGFRQGPGGFATAPFYGVFGLQIDKVTGGRFLFGTQRPDELRSFLANRVGLNPVSAA